MINLNITNRNEFTKQDFDKFVKDLNLEVFEFNKVQGFAKSINDLIKKSETEELSKSETDTIEKGTVEVQHLHKLVVVGEDLQKSIVYVRPQQIGWSEEITKSESGEEITKGVYLDTELNKALDRVGLEIIKGKDGKSVEIEGEGDDDEKDEEETDETEEKEEKEEE